MAASSSATRMLPAGINSLLGSAARLGVVTNELVASVHGHEDTERRMSRLRFAFDDPAVVTHDLRNQSKPEASSGRLGGNERVEQVRHQVIGHPWPVIFDAEFERQRHPRLAA